MEKELLRQQKLYKSKESRLLGVHEYLFRRGTVLEEQRIAGGGENRMMRHRKESLVN